MSSLSIALSVLMLVGCERAKTRLDKEVDRLCALDGGVHVYETVQLPKENFGPDGEVFPQFRGLPSDRGRLGTDYYLRSVEEILVQGDPKLVKSTTSLIRKSDSKVLGARINYSRRGGDLPGPWHESARSCLDVLPRDAGLERLVFSKREDQR